jgi:hypothetical protein
MEYLKTCADSSIYLGTLFQLILWLPLGAWNDQSGNRLITVVKSGEAPLAAITFASLMLLPSLLFALAYCETLVVAHLVMSRRQHRLVSDATSKLVDPIHLPSGRKGNPKPEIPYTHLQDPPIVSEPSRTGCDAWPWTFCYCSS